MATASGSIHANTGFLQQFADELDPSAATAAKAAATEVRGTVSDCGDPLPGCQQFNATVTRVTDQIIAFCVEVEQGIQAYASVARDSAAAYVYGDETGRTAIEHAAAPQSTSGR
ncbi:excreted virulence factor EspC (type VII ESX diderm) [Micromonospora pisi]|uniref:Excreted virulence factor EspC (Type VII ESX diderm) n=1 Tax=Micromonospora pisi TaxID=589240 RepID=A0A495JTM4_9ACTN|nr:type VII secretion target [Micromonospora pisi]RKR91898.1 excreted virulence factor EspC (type VII ESX diderm) [Micromonospora pisi]